VSDLYRTLRVSPRADQATIKAAYRRLARRVHPDVNPGSDATERMKSLNEAYAVLRDPGRRHAYDRERLRLVLSETAWSTPTPYPYAPAVWEEADEPISASTERWRIILRGLGTIITLIGIAILIWSTSPLALPRQAAERTGVLQSAAAQNR